MQEIVCWRKVTVDLLYGIAGEVWNLVVTPMSNSVVFFSTKSRA